MNTRKIKFLKAKRKLKQVLGKDVWSKVQREIPKEFHGGESDGWCVASNVLSADDIVYSIGVGLDISFDLSLIERYGVQIYAFDPTPQSIEWIRAQSIPDSFHFTDVGIASFNGKAQFYKTKKESNTCHTMKPRTDTSEVSVEVPVNRLHTLCMKNNHSHINLLKVDIEGAEYEVLADIMKSDIRIDQLLVEFHHRFENIPIQKTYEAIGLLNENNFKIFHISLKGREYSFIHDRIMDSS